MTTFAIQPSLFPKADPDEIATDTTIARAAAAGAWFVFSLSGGKDCGAVAALANLYLDGIGHPRERRICMHADLGRAEWPQTPAQVQAQADALGLPLVVVRAPAGDLPSRFANRWERGCADYADLLLYNMRGPWSSPSLKFCQSEKKIQVMGPALARRFKGETIVQVTGLRREESAARRSTPVAKADYRFAKLGNKAGTRMLVWNPGVELTTPEVFAANRRHGIPLAHAYALGCSRYSCAACIMGSDNDLTIAGQQPYNAPLFSLYARMEIDSTFSFQMDTWLADKVPHLLTPEDMERLARAKILAKRRRDLEASMPPDHRYVDGWPLLVPSEGEAKIILDVRTELLATHELITPYTTTALVIDRFADLKATGDAKRAAKAMKVAA